MIKFTDIYHTKTAIIIVLSNNIKDNDRNRYFVLKTNKSKPAKKWLNDIKNEYCCRVSASFIVKVKEYWGWGTFMFVC